MGAKNGKLLNHEYVMISGVKSLFNSLRSEYRVQTLKLSAILYKSFNLKTKIRIAIF